MSARLVLATAAVASLVGMSLMPDEGVSVDRTRASVSPAARTEVVVALSAPPLAYAHGAGRRDAISALQREQTRFVDALHATIPSARVRWRYRTVQNGLAVITPRRDLPRLARLPGVTKVYASARYGSLAGPAREAIGAKQLTPLPGPATGEGLKIGIIDDGVDQTHAFFDPAGYTMPAGFPRGVRAFTTAKVIVARAFMPAGTSYRGARLPFDDGSSQHGTHVAGIAAGNAGTSAQGVRISGVAPRAYIGNYKALGIPTDGGVGLNGNAPEIVAAIEAAVNDGMDVINLSLGEPEIEPDEDVVARALDAAAAAGVVPVVAAGNDFDDFGYGSVTSPGSAEDAITVAAVTESAPVTVAGFSSAGPTAISLRLKPDVAAPGVGILSSVPGGWEELSGTSMAAPHVAGAAALLLQRHPTWTPDNVKAALVETARPVRDDGRAAEPVRAGGGLVDLPAADTPRLFASPTGISFGLLADGATTDAVVILDDAGNGVGTWTVSVEPGHPARAAVTAPAAVDVPGNLTVSVAVAADATDADLTGAIVLRNGASIRRIPFWGRLATPRLAAATATPLLRPGVVKGNTSGRPSNATVYRYPDVPESSFVTSRLRGPEQLFSVRLTRSVANFGVVIVARGKGVSVEPRLVEDADENRLTGYPALPFNLNPYVTAFGSDVLAAGALDPAPGRYTVVFDSARPDGAGAFTFRYWVDDTRPPSARLLSTGGVRRTSPLRVAVADTGSGVDPDSVVAKLDGRRVDARFSKGTVTVSTRGVARGSHVLRLQVSDYQETRNMENVARILPNTRVLRVRVTVK
jgi:hypothetical protein